MSDQQSVIHAFSGDYAFLSNFWQEPVGLDGLVYPSVEHAFQASKTKVYHVRLEFTDATMTCLAAKRKGRLLSLRDDWEAVKVDVMLACLHAKFRPGYDLARRLLETGAAFLIEGNTWHDNVWGDCHCGRPQCSMPGRNRLGYLLMAVRCELNAR